MPKKHKPRSGSLQFWPRKRARRIYARVRSKPKIRELKPLGFAGYKVGMSHVVIVDNRTKSTTKGEKIVIPITILECPPLKVYAIRFYSSKNGRLRLVTEVNSRGDKYLSRKIKLSKNINDEKINKKLGEIEKKLDEIDDIRLVVYTQPHLTQIGKKKPEIFEIGIGGNNIEEKFKFAKEKLGKEIWVKEVINEGCFIDVHAITKGKGTQGPVKRFGIGLKSHKSEKGRRAPGSLGPWNAQGHILYRVAHAGQTGFHQRTEYCKWVIAIKDDPKHINPKGGFVGYGIVKNPYILVKGSVPGPRKRLIIFNSTIRDNSKKVKELSNKALKIVYISLESKQG